jgi:hypothetical protein
MGFLTSIFHPENGNQDGVDNHDDPSPQIHLKPLAMRGRLTRDDADEHEKSKSKQTICTSLAFCGFFETEGANR